MPGGSAAIAGAREKVSSFVFGCGWRKAIGKPPSVLHYERVVLPLDTDYVYISVSSVDPAGCGVRVTQWMNPLELTFSKETDALQAYAE